MDEAHERQTMTADLLDLCSDYEQLNDIAKKVKADRHYLSRSQELDWKDINVLVEENVKLKAHILSTIHADDDEPVTVDYLVSLGFFLLVNTVYRSPLHADYSDCKPRFTLRYESQDPVPVYRQAWGRWEIGVPGLVQSSPVQPHNRGQLRSLCKSLGVPLNDPLKPIKPTA